VTADFQDQLANMANQMALLPVQKFQTEYQGYEIQISLAEAAELYQRKTGYRPTRAIVPMKYEGGPAPKGLRIEPTPKQTYIILLTHQDALWGGVQDERSLNDRRIDTDDKSA